MTNQEEKRVKSEIRTCLNSNNIDSLKDFIEAELDGLIDEIYGTDETEGKEFSSEYLAQIDKVLRNGPPFSEKEIAEVVDVILPLIFTHDLADNS